MADMEQGGRMMAQGGGGAAMDESGGGGGGDRFPVDDATYDLISALAAKLESVEVMERYAEDDESGIFEQIADADRQHAEQLLDALRQRLGGG
jgi:hypothetical protein